MRVLLRWLFREEWKKLEDKLDSDNFYHSHEIHEIKNRITEELLAIKEEFPYCNPENVIRILREKNLL